MIFGQFHLLMTVDWSTKTTYVKFIMQEVRVCSSVFIFGKILAFMHIFIQGITPFPYRYLPFHWNMRQLCCLLNVSKIKENEYIRMSETICGTFLVLRACALYSTIDESSDVLKSGPTRKKN